MPLLFTLAGYKFEHVCDIEPLRDSQATISRVHVFYLTWNSMGSVGYPDNSASRPSSGGRDDARDEGHDPAHFQ